MQIFLIGNIFYIIYQMFKNNVKKQGRSITDNDGLKRAYEQGDAYPFGDTLVIAGSHAARDWYAVFTKKPAWGNVRNAYRYQQAEKALKANPNIKTAVGHSLGASVRLELQKNYPYSKSRTNGGPIWDPLGSDSKSSDRYRNYLDPISIFDRSAKSSFKANPLFSHNYDNIAKFKTSGNNACGWINKDQSISLIQKIFF